MRSLLFTFLLCACCYAEVTFDWATVGNPGNLPDPMTGRGSVDYVYRISKHEVTNAQYAEFLNVVGAEDPGLGPAGERAFLYTTPEITRVGDLGRFSYEVKAGLESRPVREVSFLSAARFTNWLENGQPSGLQAAETTEAGVYTISSLVAGPRSPDATFFIPTDRATVLQDVPPDAVQIGRQPTDDQPVQPRAVSDRTHVADRCPDVSVLLPCHDRQSCLFRVQTPCTV